MKKKSFVKEEMIIVHRETHRQRVAQIIGTIQRIQEIRKSKTVVWNGPVGLFEFDQFAIGTNSIAKVLADIEATTIIGGGDSAAAVKKALNE